MSRRIYRDDSLLMLTAVIWGTAFVAQRVGMDHVGPLTFNGVRFALGALTLLPLALRGERTDMSKLQRFSSRQAILGGGLAGLALFAGATPGISLLGIVVSTMKASSRLTRRNGSEGFQLCHVLPAMFCGINA